MKTIILSLITLAASSSFASEFRREFAEQRKQQAEYIRKCEANLAACSCYDLQKQAKALHKELNNLEESTEAPTAKCLANIGLAGYGDGPGTTDWNYRAQAKENCRNSTVQAVAELREAAAPEIQGLVAQLSAVESQKSVTCQ